ncbi:MAG: hypothetical protein CL679_09615 [Bermanella sp.]|nr:hypothetical protein [Bermanella sp.]|tara:strand:+ start:6134 stop:6556 length:423 start_codon:yes stop_codon:yes gene_type:complete
MRKLPLFLMLLVLVTPFAVSIALLDSKQNIADKARGEWLQSTYYVDQPDDLSWQVLWRNQDCQPNCDAWFNLLQRVKMALGKNQDKIILSSTDLDELRAMDNGLFIANQKGLVLLSYQATDDGAYKLLKDLKVLLKHNSQ